MTMLLAALLVASNPAVAPQQLNQTPAPAPVAVTPPAPAPKKERIICKADPEFTGTRISKEICLTKSEWKRRAAADGASN